MNLHEYQAKSLLSAEGIPVPRSILIDDKQQARELLTLLGGEHFVMKAQVHAGGRGKAGGVKLVDNIDAALDFVDQLLGTRLVTYQTDAKGQPINQILVEEPSDIERELYLGAVVDRSAQRIVFMASTEGGMDIETVAHKTPDKILKSEIDPKLGAHDMQAQVIAKGLGLDNGLAQQFTQLFISLAELFVQNDLSLIEINPLVVTKQGQLICLDAKINLDDNALYRHKDLQALRDLSQEDEREVRARQWELNYISLDGEIGCMVNGAGLAMATMDLIKLHGREPANFLDVGGTATKQRVAEAFKIILSDEKVKGILVNIFGGIVRCDMIAEGIVGAVAEVGVNVPVVVRLQGNNAERGLEILNNSKLSLEAIADLNAAAQRIVELVGAQA